MERTVLVTGCSSGIGHATAEAFLSEGWTVIATAREEADITDLAEKGALTHELDVTKPAQCQDVIDWTIAETGRLDCLVNNAGYAQFGPLEDVPTRHVESQFDVNVFGPHRLVRAALPHMREAERGTIVNVSSVSGLLSAPGMGVYSASKAALESMSDALRAEVTPFDIDVALVEPGPVDTQFEDRAQSSLADLDRTAAYEDLYGALTDAGIVGEMGSVPPERVADVILEAGTSTDPQSRYTVGPAAKYLTLARLLPDRVRDRIFSLLRRLGA
ncbi:short-chain dehydrogenase/reductase [Halodesulfurarchaeum formicicum]|uniref:Short-chain dehydrogenase/reductase n=1 Tax=Halodesulfurarchaeum formicicum TaxID=1873524 RepID=A0A1D8S5E9_9EURY|nr:SDR family oxidoreductase [Halodesulfurarchaeum formicicum]AOW80580.1 short-chain dehydrogenase/reductase [Halodesulfurarchaeum formicicum]APE95919.1 short-chain dehydrogenase/reductase [Halodesulfurarchaeum formicicum]